MRCPSVQSNSRILKKEATIHKENHEFMRKEKEEVAKWLISIKNKPFCLSIYVLVY